MPRQFERSRGPGRCPVVTLRRWGTGAVVCALVMSASGGCTRKFEIIYPEVPTTLALRPSTSTTIGPDRSIETLLPPLDSAPPIATTTIAFGEGTVTVKGTVEGPDGPVAGVTVRFERIVGEQSAERSVITDDAGRFTLPNVVGGRMRLRAWKVPDLAMARNIVVFASDTTTVTLKVDRFATTDVRWAAAPASPIEGQQVNLVVQVSRRLVDDDGVIGFEQITGMAVRLVPLGALQPDGADERLTDDTGRASFPMRCNAVGPATLRAQLASGEDATLELPSCAAVPTTTTSTITPPEATVPPILVPPVNGEETTTTAVPVGSPV